jgi:hypothetical protein
MKMSDILRDLADLIDQKQQSSQGADMSQNSTQQRMDPVEPIEPELDDNPVMVPPLQQKVELLKKSVGVDNLFDKDTESDTEQSTDLDRMKNLAGIMVSSEDNDITG